MIAIGAFALTPMIWIGSGYGKAVRLSLSTSCGGMQLIPAPLSDMAWVLLLLEGSYNVNTVVGVASSAVVIDLIYTCVAPLSMLSLSESASHLPRRRMLLPRDCCCCW